MGLPGSATLPFPTEVHVCHLCPRLLRPALPRADLCRDPAAPAAPQPRQPWACGQPSNKGDSGDVPVPSSQGRGHTALGNGSAYIPEGWVWLPFPGAGSLGRVMLPLSLGRGHWGQSLCLGKGARAKPLCRCCSHSAHPVPDAAAVRGPVPGPAFPEGPTPTLGPLGGLSRGPAHGLPSPGQRELPDPSESSPDPCDPHSPR